MEITEIRIKLMEDHQERLQAFCSITQCGCKNHLRAAYCNQCGARLKEDRAPKDGEGRAKLYADIAHPINSRCRELIQSRVIQAYQEEVVKARHPGYVCRYDDYGEDNYATLEDIDLADDPRFATAPAGQTRRIDGPAQPAAPHAAAPESISNGSSIPREANESESFGLGILS